MAKYDRIERGLGTYHAIYQYEADETWSVEIREAPICHTFGSTIRQARARIREALGLLYDDAERAIIVDEIQIPAKARKVIERARRSKERAETEQRQAAQASREAARTLLQDLGLTTRDAAEILGLSHQRVARLASESG